ncbi:translation elongation factor 1 [Cryptosporidium ubiquitum]|uniref:Translation elongation factor 1 n=1 Tax=Cryptosporidium ubiquitum TaxID=857276 RepID=A0A1J4MAZ0_9CRYT|nr:translation elongation factor 1 [Cryptosporidium ubiquitum]OII71392.1 translation elongation factor 1 [Cryptosporidium ubiquitum]
MDKFGDISTDAGRKKLNDYLSTRSYMNGASPSQDDVEALYMIIKAGGFFDFQHICRYVCHIQSFTASERAAFPGESFKNKLQKMGAAEEKKSNDDDFDLFGDDEDMEAAKKAMEAKKKALQDKKAKEKPASKSSLVLDIKPSSLDVDLDVVAKMVRELKIDGVEFSEGEKKVPVAFGLFKLQMGATIIDDLVNTQDIVDSIETLGMTDEQKKKFFGRDDICDDVEEEEEYGLVQSCEIVSFNKL